MDCSQPGSSVHGIFQARVLGWGTIAFSLSGYRFQFMKPYYFRFLLSLKSLMTNSGGKVSLLHTMANKPINSTCGAWAQLLSGMWDLPDPGIELESPALPAVFFLTESPRKPQHTLLNIK